MSHAQNISRVTSFAELLDAAKHASAQFDDARLWCRGQSDASWELIPFAHRSDPQLETQRINMFRERAIGFYDRCPDRNDLAAWLVLMQHYGLPTRLLDWTEAFATGIYFAVTHEEREKDAAIWLLAPGRLNQCTRGWNFIPTMHHPEVEPYLRVEFSAEKQLKREGGAIAVMGGGGHQRSHAQLSVYTIHNDRTPLQEHPHAKEFLWKIEIPAIALDSIREDLVTLGIRRSLLFPDLENLARELNEPSIVQENWLINDGA